MNVGQLLISEKHWRESLKNYPEALKICLKSKKNTQVRQELQSIDEWYRSEYPNLLNSRRERPESYSGMYITMEELCSVVEWKLGFSAKFRPSFKKRVLENSEELVVEHSKSCFVKLDGVEARNFDGVLGALKELCKLYGVGFATATAVISPICDLVPYFSDELILFSRESEKTRKKVAYTQKELFQVYQICNETVSKLNEECEEVYWSSNKLHDAVWSCLVRNTFNEQLQAKWDQEDQKKLIKRKRDNENAVDLVNKKL